MVPLAESLKVRVAVVRAGLDMVNLIRDETARDTERVDRFTAVRVPTEDNHAAALPVLGSSLRRLLVLHAISGRGPCGATDGSGARTPRGSREGRREHDRETESRAWSGAGLAHSGGVAVSNVGHLLVLSIRFLR